MVRARALGQIQIDSWRSCATCRINWAGRERRFACPCNRRNSKWRRNAGNWRDYADNCRQNKATWRRSAIDCTEGERSCFTIKTIFEINNNSFCSFVLQQKVGTTGASRCLAVPIGVVGIRQSCQLESPVERWLEPGVAALHEEITIRVAAAAAGGQEDPAKSNKCY